MFFKKKEPYRVQKDIKNAALTFNTLDGDKFQINISPRHYPYQSKEDGPRVSSIEYAIEDFLSDVSKTGFFVLDDGRIFPKERVQMGQVYVVPHLKTFEWRQNRWFILDEQ